MMVALVCLTLLSTAAEPPVEAPIVPDAVPLAEPGRYRSTRSYEETLDYYQRVLRKTQGIRFRDVVNLPGIKAKHIQCVRKKTRWQGINIYETRGEVRLYVVPRGES